MSTATNKLNTDNAQFTDYDISKFLLGFNSFVDATFTAAANTDLKEGMVMGQVAASGKVLPLDKDATDGSQYPFGICLRDQTVLNAASVTLPMVNKGRVLESKLNFLDVETLATTIGPANNLRTVRALLNDLGFELMAGIELTAADNS